MNKDQILELLKTVSYPGFTRDIVSFGIVQHIQVEKKDVHIILKVSSSEQKRQEIKDLVETVLEETGSFKKINVTLITKGIPFISIPLAATSVATSSCSFLFLKRPITWSLCA